MTSRPLSIPASWVPFLQTTVILVAGFVPPSCLGTRIHSVLESSRFPERNRIDREKCAGGYYEGLIGVDAPGGSSPKYASVLRTKATAETRFTDANIARKLPGDFLMFELTPNVNRAFYGLPFTTNIHGMRDRPCSQERIPDSFRIAVLGSSIDMGWGVGTEETYVNLLEDWLNDQAVKRGIACRFEVLNFAVAAYSPLQRLETFRRKVLAFRPDLVLYSATTLDIRLLEIHLCDMLQNRVDLRYDFLREAVKAAGITERDLRLDSQNRLIDKNTIKAKLRDHYWEIYDKSLGALAQECRSSGIELVSMIIPRAGEGDTPKTRAASISQLRTLLAKHANTVFDLSGSYRGLTPAQVEISASDDHPNALGHSRLSQSLAHAILADKRLETIILTANRTPKRDKSDSNVMLSGYDQEAAPQPKPCNLPRPCKSVEQLVPASPMLQTAGE